MYKAPFICMCDQHHYFFLLAVFFAAGFFAAGFFAAGFLAAAFFLAGAFFFAVANEYHLLS